MNFFTLIDFIIVCLWALFSLWNTPYGQMALIPIIVLRISITLGLAYRQKNVGYLIYTFLGIALICLLNFSIRTHYVMQPIAGFYDVLISFFTGDTSIADSALKYFSNFNPESEPSTLFYILATILILWIVLAPIIVYVRLMPNDGLKQTHWPWSTIFLCTGIYLVLAFAIAISFNYMPFYPPKAFSWMALVIATLPAAYKLNWSRVPRLAVAYISTALLFMVAFITGFPMNARFSLIISLVGAPCLYYFVFCYIRRDRVKMSAKTVYLLAIAMGMFWIAQFTYDALRIILLIVSMLPVLWVMVYTYAEGVKAIRDSNEDEKYRRVSAKNDPNMSEFERKLSMIPDRTAPLKVVPPGVKVTIMFFVLAIIYPSICIGYNQYNCIGAFRNSNYVEYDDSPRGLLTVINSKGEIGIRDRFGYVMPCMSRSIETLGDMRTPYTLFEVFDEKKQAKRMGVYDIVAQKVIVDPYYEFITPYGYHCWKLDDDNLDPTDDLYFITTKYYVHHDRCYQLSPYPFISSLPVETYPLVYNMNLPDAPQSDMVLNVMVKSLEDVEWEDYTPDNYWEWTSDVAGEIDRIKDKFGSKIWGENKGNNIYEKAVEGIRAYIAPGYDGDETTVNYTSEIDAATEKFLAIKANQYLNSLFPEIDMRKEFDLYIDYQRSLLQYQESMLRPYAQEQSEEDSEEVARSFQTRRNAFIQNESTNRLKSINAMISVLNGDKEMPDTPHMSNDMIEGYFADMIEQDNPASQKAVDKLHKKFQQWIDYRENIASQMPISLAQTYRSITNRVIAEQLTK